MSFEEFLGYLYGDKLKKYHLEIAKLLVSKEGDTVLLGTKSTLVTKGLKEYIKAKNNDDLRKSYKMLKRG